VPRILRIINRLNLGGPTYNAAYLSRFLSPEFETVLAAGIKDESEESSEYIVEQLGLKPVYIPSMKRELSAGDDWKSYWFIRKLIKEFKPDIVHTHAAKAGTLGRLAAFHSGVPVVVHTFHGHVFHSYFSPAKTKLFLAIERYLAQRSSAIVAISPIQKKELVEQYHIASGEKIKVVGLGFDLDRFMTGQQELRDSFRSYYRLEDDVIAIGIIGRLVDVKNHPMFLKVIQRLSVSTSKKIKAFIIGDGEKRAELEALCRADNISFRNSNEPSAAVITFTSWIKNVEWALAGLDVIALTSNNEGTPVSLIEAQAAGKPVVSTETGGIADVVINGATALLSAPGDINAFYSHLHTLVDDENMRKSFSSKGPDFVRARFHYQRLVNDTAALYRKLLSNGTAN
jgi:glycosyltransferase involved in cell wall biosynthesis